MNYTSDVLIVGAGPTGLTLANALACHQVSVRIIEKKPHLSTTSRATNLMQGIQEKLAIYGLLEPMFEQAGHLGRLMLYAYGQNVSPIWYHQKGPYPTVLLLGQHHIEARLGKSLNGQAVSVQFDTELISLRQEADGVWATINYPQGQRTERFKYVVGCDGPRSVTRAFTKLNFTPKATGVMVRQVDAKLSWKRLSGMQQMWLFYYNGGFGVVIPLPIDYVKVMAFDAVGSVPNHKPTLDEMQAKLREYSGDDTATLTDPIWISHGELLTGLAPALIDGRIMLAGDAGNPILPNGGQGLNTGIQDAINLGWKLADTVLYNASPDLLHSYDSERLGFRTDLEKSQNTTLKYTIRPPKWLQFFLKQLRRVDFSEWRGRAFTKIFSQVGVHYAKSRLTVDKIGKKGLRAGYNIYDGELLRAADGLEVSLFNHLAKPIWKLLYFDNKQGIAPAVVRQMERLDLPFIESSLISSSLVALDELSHVYFDIDEIVHKRYGIRQPTFYLVRPDNHVAVRTTDFNDVEEYLKKLYPTKLEVPNNRS